MKPWLFLRAGACATILVAAIFSVGCSTPEPVASIPSAAPVQESAKPTALVFDPQATNATDKVDNPYVILISIDGYRHDYNEIFTPPNLSAIAKDGVEAESLLSTYPSKTFPNHYSIITGDYADHHGIVSNGFFDPERNASYSIGDKDSVADGSWYLTEPLWNTVEKQGLLTASFFWVGSDASIQGRRPNFYFRYDANVPNARRVDQAIEWLKLPEENRPHFITLYFSDVDTAAHASGATSPKVKAAVDLIDQQIGRLREQVKSLGLPVNIIVVSDHGMADLDPQKVILLDEPIDAARALGWFNLVGRGPQMQLYLHAGEDRHKIDEAARVLRLEAKAKGGVFHVYKRAEMKALHFSRLPRCGDIVIDPELPWVVGVKASPPGTTGGNHGWDPKYKEMQGTFLAEGPAFKNGSHLPSFPNVDIYPLILEILKLKTPAGIDGRIGPLKPALKVASGVRKAK